MKESSGRAESLCSENNASGFEPVDENKESGLGWTVLENIFHHHGTDICSSLLAPEYELRVMREHCLV